MSLDVELALREKLQIDEKELGKYFIVDEDNENIYIKVRRDHTNRFVWIDSNTFFQCKDYVNELGGSYDKQSRVWTIPIGAVKKVEPKAVSIDTMMPQKDARALDSQPAYKELGNAFPTKPEQKTNKETYATLRCPYCEKIIDVTFKPKKEVST